LNSYRVPIGSEEEEDGFDIYFTDAQMAPLQETTGLRAVNSMHVTKALFMNKTILIH
jgi:hypothetical protein